MTKTLDDIKKDTSEMFDEMRAGKMELPLAAELNNTVGKFLKAEALILQREMFLAEAPIAVARITRIKTAGKKIRGAIRKIR